MPRWYLEVLTQEADSDLRSEIGQYLKSRRPLSRKLDAGCVVEFIKKGTLCCGVIWPHVASGRLQLIVDREAAQTWIPRRRLLDISTTTVSVNGRRQAAAALELIDERRRREAAHLDMETLWALAFESADETPEGWTVDDLTDLAYGDRRSADSRPAVLRVLFAGEWFARRGDRWSPLPAATVNRRRRLADRRRRDAAGLDRLAAWLRAVADGDTESQPPSGHERALGLLEEAALGAEKGEPETRVAADLMARAHLHGPAAAFDLLVRLGHWSAHENLEIHRWQVPIEFTPEALEQTQLISSAGGVRCRRSWRRPCGWAAPDGSGCDRAFSVRQTLTGLKLSVFIAAPALLVEKDSRLDQEAATRGRSISPPDGRIPMLPPALLAAARLVEDEFRPAVAITVTLRRDLTVKSVDVVLRRVRPRVLGTEDLPPRHRQLDAMTSVAASVRSARLERACLPRVAMPQLYVHGEQASFVLPSETVGATIDEELTHLACWALGSWCRDNGVPAIYRAQARPEGSGKEEDREGTDELPARVRLHRLRRQLPRPSIQTSAAPEQVLGFDAYASLSAPGERFEDLMMQRQLIGLASGQGPAYEEGALENGLSDTASAREAATSVERSGERYWMLMALAARAGDQIDGTVIERAGLGYRILLEESGFSAYVPAPGELWAQPGDRVVVRVEQVSARGSHLTLSDPQRPST